ncbi:TPA: hypothetical protein N3A43_004436 [Salmonella enterica subsp. salamae serovar 21:z10:[z6]]|nr:hypothetical protein [Salmonella enterica]HCM1870297.1 hypothetical protein [Salmonella enterica subsp. salamae serovar 58:a:z6]HCM1897500.1 hypothetical protein [Salmonella enterica subsp. salamae serovar 58:c:z6]HCM2005831.1 hypothetical protein [Salmonella enterica subsp. salamae serovar 21:z10:[z6]]ELI0426298.1 hypothetical protein [Salmonella enterica]
MSGKPAARQGDMTQVGGPIVQGAVGVLIGAPTGVACSVCPGGITLTEVSHLSEGLRVAVHHAGPGGAGGGMEFI